MNDPPSRKAASPACQKKKIRVGPTTTRPLDPNMDNACCCGRPPTQPQHRPVAQSILAQRTTAAKTAPTLHYKA